MESANPGASRGAREVEAFDFSPYLRVLRLHWRMIAIPSVIAMLVTGIWAQFIATPSYRAEAIIRPMATSAVESKIAGFLGGFGGGMLGESGLSTLAGALGGSGNEAPEYLAILRGFHFNVDLAERHNLRRELMANPSWFVRFARTFLYSTPEWRLYRVLKRRFDCDYSMTTGNITLHFEANNQEEAERILGYYISDVRELLRTREISDASAAVASLREEAAGTSDAILRSELYSLEAKQLQRKKMAQVEADFAFRVLNAPAAPDKPYAPDPLLDSVLAALLVALILGTLAVRRYPAEEGRGEVPAKEPEYQESRPSIGIRRVSS